MNVNEFNREFDILYDNISSHVAPGLNKYEKSLFLTRAQEEIIKSYHTGLNTLKKGFEGNEDFRRGLDELVKNYKTNTQISSVNGISASSKFYEIPENTFYIVFEEITLSSPLDKCIDNLKIEVKPILHDEYNRSVKSPFRKPNKRKAWRIDTEKQSDTKVVEIISAYPVKEYHCRYIEKPKPIILTDFESDPELQGMGLTIDGYNVTTECELSSIIHRNILDRAVELAIKTYRENTLQNNVQLNTRNV